MRDPFLCPDCQKLGYCRKYNSKKLERTFDESEQAFYQRVNATKKAIQESPAISTKLMSLEQMRAQFSNQVDKVDSTPTIISLGIPIPVKHLKTSGNTIPKISHTAQVRKKGPTYTI